MKRADVETATSARDRVLDAASDLFYAQGIRAVGIDTIIERSGVAKMTLYKHFPSKDALVEAWLRRRDDRWRAWFRARIEALATTPRDRLLAAFDALGEWFTADDFRGCAFINTAVELSDPAHPARRVVLAHVGWIRGYLRELAEQAGFDDPMMLADQLLILIEGAIVSAVIWQSAVPAERAKLTARQTLAAQ